MEGQPCQDLCMGWGPCRGSRQRLLLPFLCLTLASPQGSFTESLCGERWGELGDLAGEQASMRA